MNEVRRAVFGQELLRIAYRLGGAALGERFQLRLEIGAQLTRMRDNGAADGETLALVARQPRGNVAGAFERIGE